MSPSFGRLVSEEGLRPLFKRPWFSRMWKIQEVTLSLQHQMQVLCESILPLWVYLVTALNMLRASDYRWRLCDYRRIWVDFSQRRGKGVQVGRGCWIFCFTARKETYRSKRPNLYSVWHIPGAGHYGLKSRLLGPFEPHLRNCHCGMFHKRLFHGILL